jgi:hypothetical protein
MAATSRPKVVPHSIMKSSHAVNKNISLKAFLVPASRKGGKKNKIAGGR